MVIPIHDRNPVRRLPVVTYALILVNVVVYFVGPDLVDTGVPDGTPQVCVQDAFFREYAAIPKELADNQQLGPTRLRVQTPQGAFVCPVADFDKVPAVSALTSLFLHGGLLHLLGNMLYLFIFGNNVEDRFGRLRFLLFYLLGGYTATYVFAFTQPGSTELLVGASGAIAGVLGAYLWLYPRARVLTLVPFLFFLPLPLPAWVVLGGWFLLQFAYTQGIGLGDGNVAYVAHVAGFVVGLAVTALFIGDRRHPQGPEVADPGRR